MMNCRIIEQTLYNSSIFSGLENQNHDPFENAKILMIFYLDGALIRLVDISSFCKNFNKRVDCQVLMDKSFVPTN